MRTPDSAPTQDLVDLANGATVDASRTVLFTWGARGHKTAAGEYVNKRVQIWHKYSGMEFTWLFCDTDSPTRLYVQFVNAASAKSAVRKYGKSAVDWDAAHSFAARFAIHRNEVMDLLSAFAQHRRRGRRVFISMGTNVLRGFGLAANFRRPPQPVDDDRAQVIDYFAELWHTYPPSPIEMLMPYVCRVTGMAPEHALRVVAPSWKKDQVAMRSLGLDTFVEVMLRLVYL